MDFQKYLFGLSIEEKYSFYKTIIGNGLNDNEIKAILNYIRVICKETPLFTPTMRNGVLYNLQMTSIGKYGWRSDSKGYYYDSKHPNGKCWSNIPDWLYDIVQFS